MKTYKFELTLETGEIVTCRAAGEGARIGYIAGGPGSFYFKMLSALENHYTFMTCDSLWIDDKNNLNNSIDSVTKETIKQLDYLVVKALRENLKPSAIDGWGFSAPGALLFEEALENPELYDCIIGIGIGMTELDPTFTKTNEIFYNKALPERQQSFREHFEKYQELCASMDKPYEEHQSLFKFFDIKPTTKRAPLKIYKNFLAESFSLIPKLFSYFADSNTAREHIINHWKHNAFNEHIAKEMQEHFFCNIYTQLQPRAIVEELAQVNNKILLVIGEDDYITPWTEEIHSQLQLIDNITVKLITGCGHLPYIESAQQFNEIIIGFIEQQELSSSDRKIHRTPFK